MTPSQCRAGRALLGWTRARLSEASSLEEAKIQAFEQQACILDYDQAERLEAALDEAGIILLAEDKGAGIGVRYKLGRAEVRAIAKWESEGGLVPDGSD